MLCAFRLVLSCPKMAVPVRHRKAINDRVFRKIRGGGRPVPEGVVKPEPKIYGWRPVYPADGEYTTKPLPIIKLGGRHPETGRVVVRTIGGGHKKTTHWIDYIREGNIEERVVKIIPDPCITAWVALVANGHHKRWILATHGVNVGDIVRTFDEIPRIPVRGIDGDAHPIGALAVGTPIYHIETIPGAGATLCRAAGACASYIRKLDGKCLIQLPHKRQVLLDERCMVVVGRCSNIEHGSIPIGSPQNLRAMGKRPRSGLWHRKDGYCGRKIRPPKSVLDALAPKEPEPQFHNLTFRE